MMIVLLLFLQKQSYAAAAHAAHAAHDDDPSINTWEVAVTWAECRPWEEHHIFCQDTPGHAQLTGRLTCASRPIGDTTNGWTNSQGVCFITKGGLSRWTLL